MPNLTSTPQAQGRYTFSSGARPLDGYTIKRAIGRGGFGEVYYATSDSGKEVALKLILRNLDVERRGVMQCMNLKCPNLLTIFDLKSNDAGDTFVVMEYVAGPSLASVLKQYPDGLPLARGPALAQGAGRGGRLPARSRHRPPRPQAGQSLHGRGDRQDRRLRPGQADHPQPRDRALREHRHLPLHGPRDRLGQVSQADRHLRDRRDPLRDAHRARAVRRRDGQRGADEAPDGPARRLDARRAVPDDRGQGPGQGPEPAARPGLRPAAPRGRSPDARGPDHRRGQERAGARRRPAVALVAAPDDVLRIEAEEPVFYIGPDTRPPQPRHSIQERIRANWDALRRPAAYRRPAPVPAARPPAAVPPRRVRPPPGVRGESRGAGRPAAPAGRGTAAGAPGPAQRPGAGCRAGRLDALGGSPGGAPDAPGRGGPGRRTSRAIPSSSPTSSAWRSWAPGPP